jgi:uncharacterized membrane protein YccC
MRWACLMLLPVAVPAGSVSVPGLSSFSFIHGTLVGATLIALISLAGSSSSQQQEQQQQLVQQVGMAQDEVLHTWLRCQLPSMQLLNAASHYMPVCPGAAASSNCTSIHD